MTDSEEMTSKRQRTYSPIAFPGPLEHAATHTVTLYRYMAESGSIASAGRARGRAQINV